MNKKNILLILTYYIIFSVSCFLLNLTSLRQEQIINISLLLCLLSIIVYYSIIKKYIKKEETEVINKSDKIKKLNEINKKYSFKKITNCKRKIIEREFSRKSLYNVKSIDIIRYNIENNIDFIRTDIENAIYNIKMLDDYNKEVNKLTLIKSNNTSKKFNKIENCIFNKLIYKKEDFLINVKLIVYYRSNSGKINENIKTLITFLELVNIYNAWQQGNKYCETQKRERRIMNDDIRYNVLKRDNFQCQLCGATAKDGAKLHVDHIIPVSKGGKTIMSNLQTLCDRCNIGKSNKWKKYVKKRLFYKNTLQFL